MPDQYSLFEASTAASNGELAERVTQLERALAHHAELVRENTRVLTELTATLAQLDPRTVTPPAPANGEDSEEGAAAPQASGPGNHVPDDEQDAAPPAERHAQPDAAEAPADAAVPAEVTQDTTEASPEEPDEAPEDPDPALGDYLTDGVSPAAIVGPGWVQLADQRYDVPMRHAGDVLRVAKALKHTTMPQIWVLAETCLQLGLETYPDDINASRSERIASTERNLRELPAAAEFLQPAFEAGWSCNGYLEPWTLFKHADTNKAVQVILEPYSWMYDLYGRGVIADGGSEDGDYPLAIDGPATHRANEILRRIRAIDRLWGVLPDSNPGRTAQRVLDRDYRDRRKSSKRLAVDGPGVRPELDGDAADTLDAVATEISWSRRPGHEDIETAEVVLTLDQRSSYLAAMTALPLGVGQPQWIDGDEAAYRLREGANWCGVLRCRPQAQWHEPRIFPPHHSLAGGTHPAWMMVPAAAIAVTDEDQGGAGWRLDDLGIDGAWAWPEGHTARILEPFYKTTRQALIQAEQITDARLREATVEHLKAGYKSLTGRFEDPTVLDSGRRTERFQPVWRRQIIASTLSRLFRQTRRIANQHDVWPVHANVDGIVLLTTHAVAEALTPDPQQWPDKPAFGTLRPKACRELTDTDRERLHAMQPRETIPGVLSLGEDDKGRR